MREPPTNISARSWYLQFALVCVLGSFFLVYVLGYFLFHIELSELFYPAAAFSALFVISAPFIHWGKIKAEEDFRPMLFSVGLMLLILIGLLLLLQVLLLLHLLGLLLLLQILLLLEFQLLLLMLHRLVQLLVALLLLNGPLLLHGQLLRATHALLSEGTGAKDRYGQDGHAGHHCESMSRLCHALVHDPVPFVPRPKRAKLRIRYVEHAT